MNTNQLQSIISKIILAFAAYLATKGKTDLSSIISDPDTLKTLCNGLATVLAGVSVIWSHFWHRDTGVIINNGKPPLMLLFCLCLPVFLVGCAMTPNKAAFVAEQTAATTSDSIMQAYGTYWTNAVANPAAYKRTLPGLVSEREQAMMYSEIVAGNIATVESLRTACLTNSDLLPKLNNAVSALGANSQLQVARINALMAPK